MYKSCLRKRGYLSYLKQRYTDNTTDTVSEIIYRITHNLDTLPVCKICGGPVKYSRHRYPQFCSKKCSNADPEVLAKNKAGVTKSLLAAYQERGDEIKERRAKTLSEHYGDSSCSSPFGYKEVQKKAVQSVLDKFGVDNIFRDKN